MSDYKVGDKFIIEIDKIFKQGGEELYRAKGMKSLVFDDNGLNRLSQLDQGVDTFSYKTGFHDGYMHGLEIAVIEIEEIISSAKMGEECIAEIGCDSCQYYERNAEQYPCSHCRNCYPSKFKAKLDGRENENHGG